MNVQRGDIVLVDYPYAAGSGSKVRPVVVIQNDRDNHRLRNTIVGLDHGVGHPIGSFLSTKAPYNPSDQVLHDLSWYLGWPQVADEVLKAGYSGLHQRILDMDLVWFEA